MLQEADRPIQPFLRWAGSKRQLIPHLSQLWSPSYKRYVEPFAGSAALFFAVKPGKAILGDLNRELINALRSVRTSPKRVHNALKKFRRGERNYYAIRKLSPNTLNRTQRAARFIYLNRYCFNGIWRTNKRGQFNVPYGAKRSGKLPSLSHLQQCARSLKTATLINADFRETLSRVRRGDFVYLDPPYAVTNKRIFAEYSRKEFGVEEISELERWLKKIDKKGARFVLSYIYCRESRDRFRKWKRCRVITKRKISGFTASRGAQFELRVTNIEN